MGDRSGASTERGPGLTFTLTSREERILGPGVPTFRAGRQGASPTVPVSGLARSFPNAKDDDQQELACQLRACMFRSLPVRERKVPGRALRNATSAGGRALVIEQ